MLNPLAPPPVACPSCGVAMLAQRVAGHGGAALELDLCHACHGLWIDGGENQRMAPAGVVALLRELHAHREAPQTPLAQRLGCPRCKRTLAQGVDVVRAGRYITHRCPAGHGRFSTFSSFMIEKGLVRQLTRGEVAALAEHVRSIHCSCCGAPVDLRQSDACPYCKAAFSLLDPQAVERALAGSGERGKRAEAAGAPPRAPDVADALIALERERERARRQAQQARWREGRSAEGDVDALWSAGLELVWQVLTR